MLILFDVFKMRLRISFKRRVDVYGLSPDGEVQLNRRGFLVRADLPPLTTAVPTVAAPQRASTSPSD